MIHSLIQIWFQWVHDWGYWGVFILMALESTIVPIPSEIIMPPAAYWAAQGNMNFWGVVLAGSVGSYVGSVLSYLFFNWAGRNFITKYGSYFLITEHKLKLAEHWVKDYGIPGVFIARLLPVLRHLISIPAGILKMDFKLFSVTTLIGATTWCFVLSWWGQKILGSHTELLESPEKMSLVIKQEMSGLIFAILAVSVLYVGLVIYKNKKSQTHKN